MIHSTTRLGVIAALALGLSVAAATPALAVNYTGGSLSSNSSAPGGTVDYTSNATNFDENTSANVTLECPSATDAFTVPFDSDGIVRFSIDLPADAEPGDECELGVDASTQTDTFSDVRVITIAGTPSDGESDADGLPNTGAENVAPIAWFAAGALALGIAATVVGVVTRRSRSKA